MRSHHPAPVSSPYTDLSADDRGSIDEALFIGDPGYSPSGSPPVSDDVAVHTLLADEPPNYVVPGVCMVEAHLPADMTAPPPEPTPPAPPRPTPVLAVNAGLRLAAGDTAPIMATQLRLSGGEPILIDVMVLSAPLHGALVRDGFALTGGDVFTQEDIDQNRLHYRHDGGAPERDSFTFATPDSEVPATVFAITIEQVRRAPELLGNGQLATVLDGCTIAEILDGMTRCEPDVKAGLAIVGATGRGQWQYSLDGGAHWLELGEVHPEQARLLGDGDSLRFVPRPGWSGSVKLIYHAWDQCTDRPGDVVYLSARMAEHGTTAFSKTSASATTTIAPPPFDAGQPVVEPWAGTPTVGDLFGDAVAVVRVGGPGTWQFSLDDGRSWRDFGPVYHGRARLLRASERLRFRPRRGVSGKVMLAGRPWDGRGNTAGETADLASHGSHGEGTSFGEYVRTRTWEMGEE
jgi:hypothetical protein